MDTTSTTVLSGIVTSDMLSGVLAEYIALLPICIPVAITYISIRKGLAFVFGTIKKA